MDQLTAFVPAVSTARMRRAAAVGALIATAIHAPRNGLKRASLWIAHQNNQPRWPERRIDLSRGLYGEQRTEAAAAEPHSAAIRQK